MSLEGQALDLMYRVYSGVERYLRDEVELNLIDKSDHIRTLECLELRSVTSFIPVAGVIDMYLVISFDETLLQEISKKFLSGAISVSHEDCMDMAGEFNNIVLGLSMEELDGVSIFAPPGVITDEKKIVREANMEIYGLTCKTHKGELDIYFMGPKGSFDKNLNYTGDIS